MGLKQIPYMLSLCEKMERICPNAWLLNYSNPMQCITLAAQRYSKLKVIGLCHGVMHSLEKYCEYLGVKRSDVTVKVGGVNHFELILEMKKDGKDMLPALAEAMDDLKLAIAGTLRKSDTFTKYSRSQYALLLPMESADDMAVVERRLSAAYESARTQAAAFLEFRGTVLEELYG